MVGALFEAKNLDITTEIDRRARRPRRFRPRPLMTNGRIARVDGDGVGGSKEHPGEARLFRLSRSRIFYYHCIDCRFSMKALASSNRSKF